MSDHTFIETHDPRDQLKAMGRTLLDVVPHCLHRDVLSRMRDAAYPSRHGTLVHVESGKRIDQLYSELDQVDPCDDERTLGGYMNRMMNAGSLYAGL